MLGDHELEALRDIERRFRWDSPELARLFSTVGPCQRRVAASVPGQKCRGGGGVDCQVGRFKTPNRASEDDRES